MRELFWLRFGPLTTVLALALASLPALALTRVLLNRAGRRWNIGVLGPRWQSLRTDFSYFVLAPFTESLSRVVTSLAIVGCALLLGQHVGLELLQGFGPVVRQPRVLLLAEMLVLSDLIYYWTHRLAHSAPLLWRLHAVHHSTRELHWTSAMRAHPAEIYVHLVNVVPLFLLGFPVDALAFLAPIITLYAFVIHSRADVSLRRLSYVVNTPLFHGWHHALDVTHGTKNYAGLFPLFDALFGTYHLPAERPIAVGIDDSAMPETCLAQLVYSLRAQPELESAPHATVPRDVQPGMQRSWGRRAHTHAGLVGGSLARTAGSVWPLRVLARRRGHETAA